FSKQWWAFSRVFHHLFAVFDRKFDAYLRQICLFDAYLRRSGGFMWQMTATMPVNHIGIASHLWNSSSSIASCELRASPSVKPPRNSKCLEPPCKHGEFGTTLSTFVPTSPISFRAVPDWRSYTAS